MTATDELLTLSKALRDEAAGYEQVSEEVERVRVEAEQVGKSASGSWLGYHAYVYYEDLAVPPPGAHFSQEWGLSGDSWLGLGSTGNWLEFDPDQVRKAI
jgi:hypothetical protein